MSNAKILILDIETAPNIVYSWGLYDQNIGLNQIIQESYILCWAAKWFMHKEILSGALIDKTKAQLLKEIWTLMDEADIIVGHNLNNFDIKWLNTAFLKTGLTPPSSYKTVDTYITAKSNFYFMSNKLEYLCKSLDIGAKIKTNFELWKRCMNQDKTAWNKMIAYNKRDVRETEKLYKALRPFAKNHPNLSLYQGNYCCPNCGSKDLKNKGYAYTTVNTYQRLKCLTCGKSFRGTKPLARLKSKVVEIK